MWPFTRPVGAAASPPTLPWEGGELDPSSVVARFQIDLLGVVSWPVRCTWRGAARTRGWPGRACLPRRPDAYSSLKEAVVCRWLAGYLRRVETWWRGPLVVAPTEGGRAARLKHRLEVVCVADHLLRSDRQARWLTERQLRHARVCDRCAANRRAWRRRPDGVLISGSHETAIEVETTVKPLEQYLAILDAYADQGVPSHWYAG